MSESLLEAPKAESKMGESVAHVPCLEQSVSFGRFEHDDSLCWERWSTFPSNKYLEEVEKCSTPGSVARKKAYFEAHYKKIAARKLELLELMDDEAKMRKPESFSSEDQSQALTGSVWNLDSGNREVNDEKSNTQKSVCGIELENEVNDFNEVKDVHVDVLREGVEYNEENGVAILSDGVDVLNEEESEAMNVLSEVNEHVVESNNGIDIIRESKALASQQENAHEDLYTERGSCEFGKFEEPLFTEKEDVLVSHNKEDLPQDKVEERKQSKKATEDVKLNNLKKTLKVTPTKKTTNTTSVTKKPESRMLKQSVESMARSPVSSTPKSLKPGLSKNTMSSTRPLVKKENGFTSPTTKKVSRPQIKRVLPTSMHMSLRLESANSDPPAPTPTRKSLIVEGMGDKEIIKRAFKSFQTTSQQSPTSSVKASIKTQSTTRKIGENSPTTATLQKKSDRITRATKPSSPLTSQQTTKKTSPSPLLQKTTNSVDQRNGKSVPISLSSKSQDEGNKKKEVSKNLEQKSKTKRAGMTQLQANRKKKSSQSKLSSSYNQERGSLKRLHKSEQGNAMTASIGASTCWRP